MAMTESKRIVPQKTDHAGGRKDKGGVFASCAGMNHQVRAGSGISDPGEDLRGAQSTWTVSPKKIESRRYKSNHEDGNQEEADRKSTRLNSSHQLTSYAVFCLKKKNKNCAHILAATDSSSYSSRLDSCSNG